MIQINIFLQVPKLFAIFITLTWKWNGIFRTSRNQAVTFLICLPTATKAGPICEHRTMMLQELYPPMPLLQCLPLPSKSIVGGTDYKGNCQCHHLYQQKCSLDHGPSKFQQVVVAYASNLSTLEAQSVRFLWVQDLTDLQDESHQSHDSYTGKPCLEKMAVSD